MRKYFLLRRLLPVATLFFSCSLATHAQKASPSFCNEFKKICDLADQNKIFDIKSTSYKSKFLFGSGFQFRSLRNIPGNKESLLWENSGYKEGSSTATYIYVAVLAVSKGNAKQDSISMDSVYLSTLKKVQNCFAFLKWEVDKNDPGLEMSFVGWNCRSTVFQHHNTEIEVEYYKDEKTGRYICFIDIGYEVPHEEYMH